MYMKMILFKRTECSKTVQDCGIHGAHVETEPQWNNEFLLS